MTWLVSLFAVACVITFVPRAIGDARPGTCYSAHNGGGLPMRTRSSVPWRGAFSPLLNA